MCDSHQPLEGADSGPSAELLQAEQESAARTRARDLAADAARAEMLARPLPERRVHQVPVDVERRTLVRLPALPGQPPFMGPIVELTSDGRCPTCGFDQAETGGRHDTWCPSHTAVTS